MLVQCARRPVSRRHRGADNQIIFLLMQDRRTRRGDDLAPAQRQGVLQDRSQHFGGAGPRHRQLLQLRQRYTVHQEGDPPPSDYMSLTLRTGRLFDIAKRPSRALGFGQPTMPPTPSAPK
jgi:hypothetical protein